MSCSMESYRARSFKSTSSCARIAFWNEFSFWYTVSSQNLATPSRVDWRWWIMHGNAVLQKGAKHFKTPHYFFLFQLRRKLKNSGFLLHHGFQALETIKSISHGLVLSFFSRCLGTRDDAIALIFDKVGQIFFLRKTKSNLALVMKFNAFLTISTCDFRIETISIDMN